MCVNGLVVPDETFLLSRSRCERMGLIDCAINQCRFGNFCPTPSADSVMRMYGNYFIIDWSVNVCRGSIGVFFDTLALESYIVVLKRI